MSTTPDGQTTTSHREYVVTRDFDSPRETVFRAWIDPEQLALWWGPEGYTTPVCEIDPRPGGKMRITMRSPEGDEYPAEGEYHEVIEPERIVWQDYFVDEDPMVTVVTVTLDELPDNRTRMTVVNVQASEEDLKKLLDMGCVQGWNESFDRLAAIVEK